MTSTPRPLAVQLYSLRDALAEDFERTIHRVAEMGYLGVEMAGIYGESPTAALRLFRSLGLEVAAAHVPLPLGDDRTRTLDILAALDCKRCVCAYFPPEEFTTQDKLRVVCDQLNAADEVCRANGLTLYYHNHWWEYGKLGADFVYELMLRQLSPSVLFEIDAYWVQTGGCDVPAVLAQLGERVRLMHVKDGPLSPDEPMVAVGDGQMDYAKIIPAAGHVEWLVVELDRCATDMFEAVERSYGYLTVRGLARGRR